MAKEERERRERERRREEIEGMARRAVREGRERRDREGRREMEAVKSQRFEIEVVARAAMGFLISEGLLVVDDVDGAAGGDDAGKGAKDIHRTALERLLVSLYSTHVVGIDSPANNNNNNEWALDVCRMLDRWREWGERGGMNIEDLRAVLEEKTAFCWAAVAVGVVARVCEREKGEGGGVLGDVRECLGVWKMVRLG